MTDVVPQGGTCIVGSVFTVELDRPINILDEGSMQQAKNRSDELNVVNDRKNMEQGSEFFNWRNLACFGYGIC